MGTGMEIGDSLKLATMVGVGAGKVVEPTHRAGTTLACNNPCPRLGARKLAAGGTESPHAEPERHQEPPRRSCQRTRCPRMANV